MPGNDLGCYLNGGNIRVKGNAQDQTGDTMNAGAIIIEGSSGDATGYAMRGGKIFIRGNAGYRVGIHMKAYEEQQPLIIVGGETGSFLGEYQAGGTIIVLGLGSKKAPMGNLCCAGMHGGRMFVRCEELPNDLPKQVNTAVATPEDMASIAGLSERFLRYVRCFRGRGRFRKILSDHAEYEKSIQGTLHVLLIKTADKKRRGRKNLLRRFLHIFR